MYSYTCYIHIITVNIDFWPKHYSKMRGVISMYGMKRLATGQLYTHTYTDDPTRGESRPFETEIAFLYHTEKYSNN